MGTVPTDSAASLVQTGENDLKEFIEYIETHIPHVGSTPTPTSNTGVMPVSNTVTTVVTDVENAVSNLTRWLQAKQIVQSGTVNTTVLVADIETALTQILSTVENSAAVLAQIAAVVAALKAVL